jgi:hypothetical protein
MTRSAPGTRQNGPVGTLVTLNLPADAPAHSLPWIITIGPLADEEEWEPVVCGPYEREHALALAEAVVADAELMAVVEPVQPHVTVDQINGEIAASRLSWAEEQALEEMPDDEPLDEYDEDFANPNHHHDGGEAHEPTAPPSIDEVRAGFARIAQLLTAP